MSELREGGRECVRACVDRCVGACLPACCVLACLREEGEKGLIGCVMDRLREYVCAYVIDLARV